ncbi:hypothetical protein SGODD07_01828 [Streptococcus gordonii]|uniref:YopX protein domain-containing protein n=1 Tax=Streptococcus gordonii TaxID=1302 RepID=A0A139MZZ2_STRGN|nr:hypothetical protein SGODD07_01828 [Streptococcus gordonii]
MIPKFRAWDRETKTMNGMAEIYRNRNQEIELCPRDENIILMQSTGLFDKNGQEIFEGDVVDYNGRKAIIKWHGSYASFIYRFVDEIRKIKSEWNPLYLSYYRFEIVGNIYENPELLND